MKNKILNFIFAQLLFIATANVGAVTSLEDAMEISSLRISLNDDNSGFVQGRICDHCEELKVAITPETRAYENNVEVPLKKAAGRIGRSATVFINREHTKVTRIKW
jgi:hypothetical protein